LTRTRPASRQILSRGQRGVETSFGFLQIDLLRNAGSLFRHVRFGARCRHFGFAGVVGPVATRGGRFLEPFLLAFLPKFKGRARGLAYAQQFMICNLSCGWIGQIGQKRRARIRRRGCFGHEAKAVQRNSSLRARIESHRCPLRFAPAPGLFSAISNILCDRS